MSDRDTLYDLLDGLLPEREIVRSDIAGAMVEAIEAAGWTSPAVHARLVEDVASTVRRFSATLDERDTLRARITELEAASDRVRQVHEPIEALNVRYPGGRRTEVCTGCGTDDGNWQTYPCPTIRALNDPRPVPKLSEVTELPRN